MKLLANPKQTSHIFAGAFHSGGFFISISVRGVIFAGVLGYQNTWL